MGSSCIEFKRLFGESEENNGKFERNKEGVSEEEKGWQYGRSGRHGNQKREGSKGYMVSFEKGNRVISIK